MRKMKIAIIGAGSTYSPELVSGLIDHQDSLELGSIFFMDIDEKKNQTVSGLSRRMLKNAGMGHVQTVLTADIHEAVDGADYVLTQIRVGGLEARIRDETIPLRYGLLGQETTGAGGFMKGMRTIPVMMNIAHAIERGAPEAFLINFTNPSGLITETLLNYTKVKAIGLCNCPINMIARMKAFLHAGEDFDYDFLGLNHLSFLTAAYVNGEDRLGKLLSLKLSESGLGEVLDAEYDDVLLSIIRAIPCSYLQYYYFRQDRVDKCIYAGQTRGEACLDIEKDLLAQYADTSLVTKPAGLDKRGGARYSEAAIALIDAIENDLNNVQTVDVQNAGALPFLKDSDVVEIKCRIGKHGATPVAPRHFDNDHIIGLIQAVKAYERLAAKAGVEGSYDAALAALLTHPLIGDARPAKAVLDAMLKANASYLPQFFG